MSVEASNAPATLGDSQGNFPLLKKQSRILVTGHTGMLGKALVRALRGAGYGTVLATTHAECDLTDAKQVGALFERLRPDHVFHLAARVGGIKANTAFPADFLYENLAMQNNVIRECHRSGARKLVFPGSSCIYPRECPQPMREEYLLTGPLEPTNEGYALAKIAGIRLAQYYHRQYGLQCVNPVPCNLYGPEDTFDLERSHVLSALVRRFVDAQHAGRKEVVLWGTGSARREFLHVEDAAEALLFLAASYESPEIINVGTGTDVSVRELADLIAGAVGYEGRIAWDGAMPDGMPRKCVDVSRIAALGYRPRIGLAEGIRGVVQQYRELKKKGAYP